MKRLGEIFDIKYGTDLELINCDEDINGIPYISRGACDNGVVSFVKLKDDVEPMPGNAITVALGGSVLSSFYQEKPFYTSFHIFCLYPKTKLLLSEMIFYCAAIEKNKYKYNYGRQANKTLKDIIVPSPEEIPTKNKRKKISIPFTQTPILSRDIILNTSKWKWFKIGELFEIKKGKRLTKEDYIQGNIPFIGSTEFNNGITAYVGNDEYIHEENVITVTYNGSIAEAFYQAKEFWASDDINVLYPKFNLNKYAAMFICTIIEKEKYRYNYGRKWYAERMIESVIKLPIKMNLSPDWEYIESFIKSLPY